MDKFTCFECNGICCINPPELRSIGEIDLVISKGRKVIAVPFKGVVEKYTVLVAKDPITKTCPFRGDSGACVIWEMRPQICRDFECKLHDMNKDEALGTIAVLDTTLNKNSSTSGREPFLLTEEDIKKYGVEKVTIDKALDNICIDVDVLEKIYSGVAIKNKGEGENG